MSTPSISIIIPVYNSKKYLVRCLDSILNQTISDFECILIDDCSTDDSGVICDDYALRDDRFNVIHCNVNRGPGGARNIGLLNVKAHWVTFVDADDYVDQSYLFNFIKYNLRDIYTQVIQGYHTQGYDGTETNTLYPGTEYPFQEVAKGKKSEYISDNNILVNCSVWCKIFSIEVIRNNKLRFEERIWCGEDGIFWHKYLCYIDKIIFAPEIGYTYYCPRVFNSVSRMGKFPLGAKEWIAIAENYKYVYSILPNRFIMGRKSTNFIKYAYLNNYFRALLKPKYISKVQLYELECIRPEYGCILTSRRGIIFWIINLFPIKLIRLVRSIL